MIDSLSINTKTFTVCRSNEIIKFEIACPGQDYQSSIQIFQNEIIIDELGNQYIVTQVLTAPPLALFPYILKLKLYNPMPFSVGNINNSNVIINSPNATIQQEIAKLPTEVQAIAQELVSVLCEYLKTKTKPKNFAQKFGDFIAKYGSAIGSIGSLALQSLPLILGNG